MFGILDEVLMCKKISDFFVSTSRKRSIHDRYGQIKSAK